MSKPPWHFWVVAVLALLWNGFGGADYTLTNLNNPGYMAMYTPEQQAYYARLSFGEHLTWAVGVWSAVIGSVLFILRKKLAVLFFLIQLVGIAGMLLYTFWLNPETMKVMGPMAAGMGLFIAAVGAFLAWYSAKMRRKGVIT